MPGLDLKPHTPEPWLQHWARLSNPAQWPFNLLESITTWQAPNFSQEDHTNKKRTKAITAAVWGNWGCSLTSAIHFPMGMVLYLNVLETEFLLICEVRSPSTEFHEHLGDLGLYGWGQSAGSLHHMLLHIFELHGGLRVVWVPEHGAEEICEERASTAKDIEGIQVLGDALLDVSNGSGVGHGMVAAACSCQTAQWGRGGRGGQGSVQCSAQLRHRVLLVLLHLLLGPAKQEAPLVVHLTVLGTAAIHAGGELFQGPLAGQGSESFFSKTAARYKNSGVLQIYVLKKAFPWGRWPYDPT